MMKQSAEVYGYLIDPALRSITRINLQKSASRSVYENIKNSLRNSFPEFYKLGMRDRLYLCVDGGDMLQPQACCTVQIAARYMIKRIWGKAVIVGHTGHRFSAPSMALADLKMISGWGPGDDFSEDMVAEHDTAVAMAERAAQSKASGFEDRPRPHLVSVSYRA